MADNCLINRRHTLPPSPYHMIYGRSQTRPSCTKTELHQSTTHKSTRPSCTECSARSAIRSRAKCRASFSSTAATASRTKRPSLNCRGTCRCPRWRHSLRTPRWRRRRAMLCRMKRVLRRSSRTIQPTGCGRTAKRTRITYVCAVSILHCIAFLAETGGS